MNKKLNTIIKIVCIMLSLVFTLYMPKTAYIIILPISFFVIYKAVLNNYQNKLGLLLVILCGNIVFMSLLILIKSLILYLK